MCLWYQEKKLLAEIKRTAKTGNEVSSAFHAHSWGVFCVCLQTLITWTEFKIECFVFRQLLKF